MTVITFSFCALPALPDGRNPVHLYLRQEEPTWNLSPGAERKAIKDAAQIVSDIVRQNTEADPGRLLRDGCPPDDSALICFFRINVSWNRKLRLAEYSKGDYARTAFGMDSRWNPVAECMMELRDYIYGVLHKRQKKETKEKMERINRYENQR